MKALYYLFNYITFPPSPHFTIGRKQVDKDSTWIALSLDKAVKGLDLGVSLNKQTHFMVAPHFNTSKGLDRWIRFSGGLGSTAAACEVVLRLISI